MLQSQTIRGAAGKPLPTVFKALAERGAEFLLGQLVLVAAGPGTGKSLFTLTLALRSKVPTLYFSADSDAFTQLTRSVSVLTGWRHEDAAKRVLAGDLGMVSDLLTKVPIRLVYEASPTLDDIERATLAYDEVYGHYPQLVVIDNITNVSTEASGEDPFAGLEALTDYLHGMARQTGACVVCLHHVTGPYVDAEKPIPLSGVKGQITRVPELVLTLFRPIREFGGDVLGVSTVKNRAGRADPSGADFAELEWIGDTMTVRDLRAA
ncbi:AAA family ATPase [Nocardia brasiliensis]|uniref:AAA family ATPase n=1 Tax=Nocardia brasiliensis TaxID=37326 RepID=UPI00366F141B